MNHLGKRLVDDSVSRLSDLKSQIRILTVGRSKPFVKASNPVPQFSGKQYRGTRYIVHIFYIIIFGLVRIIQTAVIPSRTVAPDDASRLLKTAVRINQLGSDHTDRVIRLNQTDQRTEPALRHLCIIV